MRPKFGYIARDIVTDTVEVIWSVHLPQLAIGLKMKNCADIFHVYYCGNSCNKAVGGSNWWSCSWRGTRCCNGTFCLYPCLFQLHFIFISDNTLVEMATMLLQLFWLMNVLWTRLFERGPKWRHVYKISATYNIWFMWRFRCLQCGLRVRFRFCRAQGWERRF
jgi:hypothetical protein